MILGYVKSIDALELGLIAVSLGAGRAKAGDPISYEVGFKLLKKIGDPVNTGKLNLINKYICYSNDLLF